MSAEAQDEREDWQRVFTEAGNYVDVSVTSLILEPNHVFRARFRTTLPKSENVDTTPGVKYKSRIDIIQFDSRKSEYRIAESDLLDSSGKVVSSHLAADTEGWRQMKSPTATQLYSAAMTLPPFGAWKVISYRYADGKQDNANGPPELEGVLGSSVNLAYYQVQIGKEICSSPLFETRTMTNAEFTKLTTSSLSTWGIDTDKADILVFRCESTTSSWPQSLILRLTNGELQMFWNGVILHLQRFKDSSFKWPLVIKQ
jgi:hypothetical protein